jgi:hypothetical protein
MSPQPSLPSSPPASAPALPRLWPQLPRDQQHALAAQLAVLLRRHWTQAQLHPGGDQHEPH